jgi:hypothetical protein
MVAVVRGAALQELEKRRVATPLIAVGLHGESVDVLGLLY